VVAYSDGATYNESIWDIGTSTAIAAFTIFAVKIVFRSTSTSTIPMCQDLRAIALRK
jgi:hypothetical protein